MSGPARVTDHAVLRYLERIHGLDVEGIRCAMEDACARGIATDAPSIRIDNTRFINRDGRIVTVLSTDMPMHFDFLVRTHRTGEAR